MEFSSLGLCVSPTTLALLLLFLITFCWTLLRSILPPSGQKEKLPPGPVGLPIVGYLPFLGKEPNKKLMKMRKKYGDIIGLYLGPKYTVILNEYNVMKEVLSHPGTQNRAASLFDLLPYAGFVGETGEKWIAQRRFCLTATRDAGLGSGYWEELIMEETANFMDKLGATKGKAVDVSHDLASSLTSNIIALLIGRKLEEDKEADKVKLTTDFANVAMHYLGPSMPTSVIPGLRKFCEIFRIAGYNRVSRIVQNFSLFVKEEIRRHKTVSAAKDKNDFMNIYLENLSKLKLSRTEKHTFSEEMLEGNVTMLFLGATDTIFNSLSWLLRLMAAHKDIQEKVHAELIEVLGEDGRARYDEREKIPYTFATIMEAQRFSSIIHLSGTRRANQDIHIKNFTIPKGSDVTANLWALHNDPANWEQPEVFRPERFLKENGTRLDFQSQCYAPFSFGRRKCPGATIAYIEILLYLSEVVRKFEICVPPGIQPDFKVINGLVTSLEPQPLCFKKRKDDI